MNEFLLRASTMACTLFALASCQTAHMRVPASLKSQAPEIACSGRQGFAFNEAFDCGPYRVAAVHRSWTTTRSWDDLGFESSRADQHYEFALEAAGGVWDGQCAVGANVDLLELEEFLGGTLEIRFLDERFLVGVLRSRQDPDPWRLAMGQSTDELTMQGVLTRGNVEVRIEGTNRLASTSIPASDPTGYVFSLDGQQVAAVEVINDGALWILPAIDSNLREVLAAASAALLLYQDLLEQ